MTKEEIEKAAGEYSGEELTSGYPYVHPAHRQFIEAKHEAFKAGANFANKLWQEKTRWIPVEERLPQIQTNGFSDMVLTRDKHGIIKLERYDQEFNQFSGLRYGGEVTHWKEID